MSKKWTDEDVARMLGWEQFTSLEYGVCATAWWRDNKKIEDDCFGLSTTPGPESDANAARYVLPWLRSQSIDIQECVMNALIEVWIDSGQTLETFAMWIVLCMDGPTLCTAALEAYHAGRMDDGA